MVSETPVMIEGTTELPRFVLLEFPSREAFHSWYDSPEYQAIIHLRHESVIGTIALLEG